MNGIKGKKPRVVPARAIGVALTNEERFVLDRINGELSVSDLGSITGIDEARVEQIVSRLAFEGAVELAPEVVLPALPDLDDGGKTSMAELAAVLGMDPSAFADAEPSALPATPPAPPVTPRVRYSDLDDSAPWLEPASGMDTVRDLQELANLEERSATPASEPIADPLETTPDLAELEEVVDEDAPAVEEPRDEEAIATEAEEISRAVAERNYREVYEKRWHELTVDQRIAGARSARGADLLALCFDPDPRVIAAILENATCGLDHVRLIAFHHRNGMGLEIVARRQDWLRDLLVERRLLRNPMASEIVLGRIMGPKRLFPTYKIAIDRDIPELSRVRCRGYIRQKWQTAPPEERADFLLRTEARCLSMMTGCTFDAKTTSILCGRPINSAMFVQSIAKFGASPPGLLAHLMKQPFVRKNAPLKKMLLAHPNMPGDVKRSI
jgi:hypothetical protein